MTIRSSYPAANRSWVRADTSRPSRFCPRSWGSRAKHFSSAPAAQPQPTSFGSSPEVSYTPKAVSTSWSRRSPWLCSRDSSADRSQEEASCIFWMSYTSMGLFSLAVNMHRMPVVAFLYTILTENGGFLS